MIFFVLSGFFLALSLEADGETYLRFLVKRIFRIMPPLALAVLFSAELYLAIDPHPLPGLAPWFYTAGWTVRPDTGTGWPIGRFSMRHAMSRLTA